MPNITDPQQDTFSDIQKYHGEPASKWFYAGWLTETLKRSLNNGETFLTLNPAGVNMLRQLVLDYGSVVDAHELVQIRLDNHSRRATD